MNTIIYQDQKYVIPTSWEQVTLQQYIDYMTIPSGITESNKKIKILNIMTGAPIDVIRDMEKEDINSIARVLSFMNYPIKDVQFKDLPYFDFKGETYYAEPVSESKFGAFLDYEHHLEQDGQYKALPYLLAICCRKQKEKYGAYDMFERAELFRGLPMPVVRGVAGFFLTNYKLSSVILTNILLLKETAMKLTESTENYLNSMVGKGTYLKRWQIKMLLKSMQYLKQKQSW